MVIRMYSAALVAGFATGCVADAPEDAPEIFFYQLDGLRRAESVPVRMEERDIDPDLGRDKSIREEFRARTCARGTNELICSLFCSNSMGRMFLNMVSPEIRVQETP
ncbi:predicted protein [Postia placenta Mad-698-R]|nr:predicted protein [Postia placenta Mad-698-R]